MNLTLGAHAARVLASETSYYRRQAREPRALPGLFEETEAMKLTLVVTIILAITTSLLTPGQTRNKPTNSQGGQSMNSNAEQEILKLEEEYRQAAIRLDVAALDRIFADDLITTAPNGMVVGKE